MTMVTITETTIEPRQPMRFEKKKNISAPDDGGAPVIFRWGFVYLPAAASRGPSHIRIIAIGSAGQNMSGDAIRVEGSAWVEGATTGSSTRFAVVAPASEALFLRTCRRRTVDLLAFFAASFALRGFLAFRICCCHL
jgi:hypothetical protein